MITKLCELCNKEFELKYSNQRFCSKSCFNVFQTTSKKESVQCLQCNTVFTRQVGKKAQQKKFCSMSCSASFNNKLREPKDVDFDFIKRFRQYRDSCGFRKPYGNEDLVQKYGWFNRKTNPNGLHKDHCYSIFDGFKNQISPKIMKHPANLQLLTASDNLSKGRKSSITLEELLEKIKHWPS